MAEEKKATWPTEATVRQLGMTDPAVHAALMLAEINGRSFADAMLLAVTALSDVNSNLMSQLFRARLAGFKPEPMTWPELDPLRRPFE